MAELLEKNDCTEFVELLWPMSECINAYNSKTPLYRNVRYFAYIDYGPQKVAAWLVENNIQFWIKQADKCDFPVNKRYIRHVYGFKNKEDAFAFTMRWI